VTISGANFSPGAVVTIGGIAAATATVENSTTIAATAPPHAAGAADVVVTSNGQTASLAGGLTYVTNAPPAISTIVVRGSKPREPAQFADLDETVSVTATVTDAETPASQLTFNWSADGGTFNGSGPAVTWTAPHTSATPTGVTLTLTVTERFQTATGATGENKSIGTTTVRLHNSPKEVGDLAVDFLTAFSKQLDPDFVVRNFSDACTGKRDERADVAGNQQDVTITFYNLGAASTTVPFTGHCDYRNRNGDACAYVPAEWHSLIKAAKYHTDLAPYIGRTMSVTGTDQVTAILENDQWKLCASDWDQASGAFISREGHVTPTTLRFRR